MIKKISAIVLSVVMAGTMLAACGESDSSAADSGAGTAESAVEEENSATESGDEEQEIPVASMTIDGEAVDISEKPLMLTIDGTEIDFDLFRYYYFYISTVYEQYYGITIDQLESDADLYSTFKTAIVNQFKNDFVSQALARENGIELTEEEKEEVQQNLVEFKGQYESEEAAEKEMALHYLTDDVYISMMTMAKLYEKVDAELFGENGKLVTSKEDFVEIALNKDEYSRVRHILIPYYCKAEITDEETKASYEDMSLYEKGNAKQAAYEALSDEEKEKVKEESKKLADDVLKKAQGGEDFEKLIEEYGWDPGMEVNVDGYFVNKSTNFVEPFKTTCFELDEGEVSDLVESDSYGWFIIKRLPIEKDYVEENYATLVQDYDEPRFDEIMNEAAEKMDVVETDYFTKLSKFSDIT